LKNSLKLLASIAFLALPACSSVTNGTAWVPPQNPVNLQTFGKPTFAVGTARLQDGTVGLNVVAYMRQANGLSAFLVDTPSIAGPSGFTVPTNTLPANGAGGSGADGGTSTINATSQTASPPPSTTFGTAGGVYGGGLGPFNATNTASNFYPGNANPSSGVNPTYSLPFYEASTAVAPPSGTKTPAPTDPEPFLVGPPAKGISVFNNVDFPSSPPFEGYLAGFTAFEAAPVGGTYTMTTTVPAANASAASFTSQATLKSLSPLPALPAPVFTGDASKDGGGTVSVAVPSDPRISETLIFVHDLTNNSFYTVGPLTGTGLLSGNLPANLGACNVPPCNSPTMAVGDTYVVYAVSFDYPDFESIQPVNTQQTPAVTGAGGQADVSISPSAAATY
jgi:hypothetical protein